MKVILTNESKGWSNKHGDVYFPDDYISYSYYGDSRWPGQGLYITTATKMVFTEPLNSAFT